jgi:hypothetical protein
LANQPAPTKAILNMCISLRPSQVPAQCSSRTARLPAAGLKPYGGLYVRAGTAVLDLGCGIDFASTVVARAVGDERDATAVDAPRGQVRPWMGAVATLSSAACDRLLCIFQRHRRAPRRRLQGVLAPSDTARIRDGQVGFFKGLSTPFDTTLICMVARLP